MSGVEIEEENYIKQERVMLKENSKVPREIKKK